MSTSPTAVSLSGTNTLIPSVSTSITTPIVPISENQTNKEPRTPINAILPSAIFQEIFKFLPVSEILKVQSVCFDWQALPLPAYLYFRHSIHGDRIRDLLTRPQCPRLISFELHHKLLSDFSSFTLNDLSQQKGKLDRLKTLIFRGARGTLNELSGLTITHLDLSESAIYSNEFFDKVKFPVLRILRLNNNARIGLGIIKPISQFPGLQQLEMASCRLYDGDVVSEDDVSYLSAPCLELLDLRGNDNLTNRALIVAAQCSNLTNLKFGGLNFNDVGLEAIHDLALRELSIQNCPEITGKGLLHLQKAKNSLETLSLTACPAIEVKDLLMFSQLQTLSLCGYNILNKDIEALIQLPNLETLSCYKIFLCLSCIEKLIESSSLQEIHIALLHPWLDQHKSFDPSASCTRVRKLHFDGYKFLRKAKAID
jgi:hypothetical protein